MNISYRTLNSAPWHDLLSAASMTTGKQIDSQPTYENWKKWFQSEHSPIRVVQIAITLEGVSPRFVAHITRHKIGVEFFVSTRRPDRCDTPDSPYNVMMVCNPQALINMARKRLCNKAHEEIQTVFHELRKLFVANYGENGEMYCALAACMVPDCLYRGMVCNEFQPCGILRDKTV